MYAGLGLMERPAGGKRYAKKLSTDYNRLLQYTAKQAAASAIAARENPFRQHYLPMPLQEGIPTHRAKLTVARSLLATMYGMWKRGEEYDPERKVQRIIPTATGSGSLSR